MFSYSPLQNQWLIVGLVSGVVVMLGVVLAYVALWRQDRPPAAQDRPELSEGQRGRMPWVLILVFVGAALWAAVYLVLRALDPPNW